MQILLLFESQILRDHTLVALRTSIFNDHSVHVANTLESAQSMLRQHTYAFSVVESTLADGNALDLVEEHAHAMGPITLLSGFWDDVLVRSIRRHFEIRAAVDARNTSLQALTSALENAYTGLPTFCPEFLEVEEQLRKSPTAWPKILSHREQVVLGLIGQAYSDEEIAHILGVSVAATRRHRHNLLRKLDLSTPLKLMSYAIQRGFCRYIHSRASLGIAHRPTSATFASDKIADATDLNVTT